ncbi:unnamed protein product [Haemonchus placei]|uniref:Flocculation protein FLO11-like n=1 Tax=Haemonchus placei TaxID=6290 RepID=A0A0N4VUX4_HAEPC|nr:unnamed protein product [Haemonchus placei]
MVQGRQKYPIQLPPKSKRTLLSTAEYDPLQASLSFIQNLFYKAISVHGLPMKVYSKIQLSLSRRYYCSAIRKSPHHLLPPTQKIFHAIPTFGVPFSATVSSATSENTRYRSHVSFIATIVPSVRNSPHELLPPTQKIFHAISMFEVPFAATVSSASSDNTRYRSHVSSIVTIVPSVRNSPYDLLPSTQKIFHAIPMFEVPFAATVSSAAATVSSASSENTRYRSHVAAAAAVPPPAPPINIIQRFRPLQTPCTYL